MDGKTLKNSAQKVIHWEDYQQQLALFISISTNLQQSQQKKEFLRKKLDSLVKVEAESLSRKHELDEISQRVENKKLVLGNMLMQAKVVEEHAKTKEEHLSGEIKSLLVSGKYLTISRKRLQCRNLADYLLEKKTLIGATQELELDCFQDGVTQGTSGRSVDEDRKKNPGTLSISGVQLSMRPFTQMSLFTDKNQIQKSTSALGYVAHAVSLIALYLHVPLRYPVRLGGSHSYIKDCAPFFEPSSSGSSSNTLVSANKKCLEFPLFLDGQDATRASYAIFLLNKDIEQLLNYVGVKSLGPRHVLANLKELYKTILSPAFLEKEFP
ncbi:hypothetical protein vseg_007843 [Gypsophila vaccaria]